MTLLVFTPVYVVIFGLIFIFPCVLADLFFFITPSCQAHWHFPEEERDFLLVQEVIRVARSLRAQCGMTKEKPASKSFTVIQPV